MHPPPPEIHGPAPAPPVPASPPPLWMVDPPPPLPRLGEDADCGVCIVGAGITGIAVALELAERGHDVVVLEAHDLGAGQTSASTAHLVTALDERYMVLERTAGPSLARAAAAAHREAIAWFERAFERYRVGAGFLRLPGYLTAPLGRPDGMNLLRAELAASRRAGVTCELTRDGPFGSRPCLRYPGQAQVDPVGALAGLAGAVASQGGRVYGGSRVTVLEEGSEGVTVRAGDRRVRARHVVLATHGLAFGADRARPVRARRSFVAALSTAGPPDPFLAWDGYWDDHTPYHYVRAAHHPRTGRPVLLVGGEDDSGEPRDPSGVYAKLADWAERHLAPGLVTGIVTGWWGEILEPRGEFALIGPAPGLQRTFMVSGDSGNGFTYAAIAARRLAGLIEGAPAPRVDEVMYRVATWA